MATMKKTTLIPSCIQRITRRQGEGDETYCTYVEEADKVSQSMRLDIMNEKGFALVAAIIASLILLAVGILVINMSTGDLRSSAITVGDKKALAAAESGIHRLVQDFSPDSGTWTAANNYTTNCTASSPTYIWRSIASGTDANTQFAICAPTLSSQPPVNLPGYALGEWAMMRYDGRVAGKNTSYNTSTTVDIGIGYGPVSIGTSSR
jgi:Tfp pilus assembly protein PilX